jgi:hypothetical protein
MIITKEIVKIVTQYNLRIFKKFGYKIGEKAIVKIEDWDINSHEKINVGCDVCGQTRTIPYRQYNESFNRYEVYCCSSKCSQFKNKITKKEKYGVDNYNNIDKIRETCLEKYGVDNVFKNIDVINKIDKIKREKYGDNLEIIVENMRKTMFDVYGVDNISKLDYIKKQKSNTTFKNHGVLYPSQSVELKKTSKITCIKKYGFEYAIQSEEIKSKIKSKNLLKFGAEWYVLSDNWKIKMEEKYGSDVKSSIDLINNWKKTDDYKIRKDLIYKKIRESNIKSGNWFSYKNDIYKYYRNIVLSETNKNIRGLFEKWKGIDYYDLEDISKNFSLHYNDRNYPTIDHKISIKYGFINNIEPKIIGDLNNLCITKRSINSTKNSKTEDEFRLILI